MKASRYRFRPGMAFVERAREKHILLFYEKPLLSLKENSGFSYSPSD